MGIYQFNSRIITANQYPFGYVNGKAGGRFTITIDHTKIDSSLADFPVMVHLSASCGTGAFDATQIFDDLGQNYKKIRIKDSFGNQCYCEVELWDAVSEKAVLHIKVNSISSTADTVLTLEWSSGRADNTAYIGATGEAAAQAVWDSNFVAVYHMSQDPSGGAGCILDSTSNGNDGSPSGSMTSGDLVYDDYGKAIDFDGTDDTIVLDNESNFDFERTDAFSIFAVFVSSDTGSTHIISKQINTGDYTGWATRLQEGKIEASLVNNVSPSNQIVVRTVANSFNDGNSHRISWTYDGSSSASGVKVYVDGALEADNDTVDTLTSSILTNTPSRIGSRDSAGQPFNGTIAEIRISNVERSAEWEKTTHESLTDSLFAITVP